jgi:hypothetical protein
MSCCWFLLRRRMIALRMLLDTQGRYCANLLGDRLCSTASTPVHFAAPGLHWSNRYHTSSRMSAFHPLRTLEPAICWLIFRSAPIASRRCRHATTQSTSRAGGSAGCARL